jgi:hypothetical protein
MVLYIIIFILVITIMILFIKFNGINLKSRYLIFYNFENNGSGNTEIIHKKIKSIDDIRAIEKELSDIIGFFCSITNYKLIGLSFKKDKK